LARYELGNILWKDNILQTKITEQETKALIHVIKNTLNIMNVQQIAGIEEEILNTAIQHKITFYDAAYVHIAKEKELQLVTEDLRLIKKATLAIKTSTLDNMEQSLK
jgi:predicted nucleic acid-binding protein